MDCKHEKQARLDQWIEDQTGNACAFCLKDEVELLKAEAKFDGESVEKQSLVIRQLREALEKHGVHTDIDCTYGDVISSPDRPQKPCVCGLEEALKAGE